MRSAACPAIHGDNIVKQSPIVDQLHGTPFCSGWQRNNRFAFFAADVDGNETEFFLKKGNKRLAC